MGRVEGKVALITGAARGQGRSHAMRLAEEGADIIGIDLAATEAAGIGTVPYPVATEEDLEETAALVEKHGRRMVAIRADVRDHEAMEAAVQGGLAELGRLDIVVANAGIVSFSPAAQMSHQAWQDVIDINLHGVWNTVRPALPIMIQAGRGGSIILTSSTAGLVGHANIAHYSAAKHGLVGLMRSLAIELGPHGIRVNTVHPTGVATPMILNEATRRVFQPDVEEPTDEGFAGSSRSMHLLDIPWVEPLDISNAVLWLASEEARYVTGIRLPVDAGATVR